MNAIEHNRFTNSWRLLGNSVERPRAVLVISAHWYTNATAATAMAEPRTIHDFYGFPNELFAFDYPAPGDPSLAAEVVEVVKPSWVGLDHDSWGLDHGTWSVLAHVFPDANVPVVQLSINALESLSYHFDIGKRLAPLQNRGVLVIASGNVVHNLAAVAWDRPDEGFDWARRFDDATRGIMISEPADILKLGEHPDFSLAVPTPDHFIPLLYLAGLATAVGATAQPFAEGCVLGSLSMTSYTVDCEVSDLDGSSTPASRLTVEIPADQMNL